MAMCICAHTHTHTNLLFLFRNDTTWQQPINIHSQIPPKGYIFLALLLAFAKKPVLYEVDIG